MERNAITMPKTYEATYENGTLKWLDQTPDLQNGARVQIIVEPPLAKHREEEVQRILDAARGTWGTGKSLEDIDREIKEMRDRDWARK